MQGSYLGPQYSQREIEEKKTKPTDTPIKKKNDKLKKTLSKEKKSNSGIFTFL